MFHFFRFQFRDVPSSVAQSMRRTISSAALSIVGDAFATLTASEHIKTDCHNERIAARWIWSAFIQFHTELTHVILSVIVVAGARVRITVMMMECCQKRMDWCERRGICRTFCVPLVVNWFCNMKQQRQQQSYIPRNPPICVPISGQINANGDESETEKHGLMHTVLMGCIANTHAPYRCEMTLSSSSFELNAELRKLFWFGNSRCLRTKQ